MAKNPKLIDKPVLRPLEGWFKTLPADARSAVESLSILAKQQGLALYLVGGPLRDLLLGHPSLDIDLSVEGDALSLAAELGAALAVKPRLHHAFGTATIPGRGWHIDLATARSETYRHPGALPHVTPASINEDLRRRDFTINAMALRLNGPAAGAFLDPVAGRDDLRAGLIRVLHERSFQDDATRTLRAARYEERFEFQIETQTLAWLCRDISYLNTITGARLHHEFARILREPAPERILLRLEDLDALSAIHSALSFSRDRALALAWLRENHPHGLASACWPLLIGARPSPEAADIAKRFALTNAQAVAVEAMPRLYALLGRLRSPSLKASSLAETLAPFPPAALWALAALEGGTVRERCLEFLERLRHVKTVLRGDDIIALGVPRGPEVGDVLRRLRVAKLDGEVRTRRDEERLVRSLLAEAEAR